MRGSMGGGIMSLPNSPGGIIMIVHHDEQRNWSLIDYGYTMQYA